MRIAFRRLVRVLDGESPSAGVFAYCAVFGSASALAVVASVLGAPLSTAMTLLMLFLGAVLLFVAACAWEAACRAEARPSRRTQPGTAGRASRESARRTQASPGS